MACSEGQDFQDPSGIPWDGRQSLLILERGFASGVSRLSTTSPLVAFLMHRLGRKRMWFALAKNPALRAIWLSVLLVGIPVVYVATVNSLEDHPTLRFEAGWTDPVFFEGWIFVANAPVDGYLNNSQGYLAINTDRVLNPGVIVAAQRRTLPPLDISQYPFLVVSIKTPSSLIAARIVVWLDPGQGITLLAKTYADREWHTEVIDLRFFGLSGTIQPFMLELTGWVIERPTTEVTIVMFRELMLAKIPEGL